MTVGTAAESRSGRETTPPGALGPAAVLVPVKAFGEAKRRLEPALDASARQRLVRQMAERVLAAATPLPVAVVCDDDAVARWAAARGALVIWAPDTGLNGAVRAGVDRLGALGVREVTVAHADLPHAGGLADLGVFPGVILAPDRRDDGTNVIRLPARSGFRFSYGPGSFTRHRVECARLRLDLRIVRDPVLAFDVDWPDDLAAMDGIVPRRGDR